MRSASAPTTRCVGGRTRPESRGPHLTVPRALAVLAELALAVAGLVWTAQGLGLVRTVRSFMNDRPEWIAIGSGTFVLALALLYATLNRPSRS